jgi:hypothetical protein
MLGLLAEAFVGTIGLDRRFHRAFVGDVAG